MNNKEIIEEITQRTFEVIKKVYDFQRETNPKNRKSLQEIDSRILFPKYSEHRKTSEIDRISEQELRFIFVEQLNKYADEKNIDLYYSVETPTKKAYVFSKDKGGPKVVGETDKDGVSARTDLAIYTKIGNEFKLGALIEFKAHNPDAIDYRKDICKLINEEANNGRLKYFIQIINVKNQKRTLGNITDKIKDVDALKEQGKNIDYCINYICFNLYSKVAHKFITGTIKNNKFEYTECESLFTEESTR